MKSNTITTTYLIGIIILMGFIIIGGIILGYMHNIEFNKFIIDLENEMGLPIVKNARIESPSLIIEVEYEMFLEKIEDIKPNKIYRIKSDASNIYYIYYIFNEDMTIAYEYSLTQYKYNEMRNRFDED